MFRLAHKFRTRVFVLKVIRAGILAVTCLAISRLDSGVADGQDPMSLPRLMDQQPRFEEVLPVATLSDQLVPLWVKAIGMQNVALQRKAAESIAVAAKRKIGELEKAGPALLQALKDQPTSPAVRTAFAKALVALDHKEATDEFVALLQSEEDEDLLAVIQPALVKWKSSEAGKVWLSQFNSASSTLRKKVWAIRGLSQLGDQDIADRLREIVVDPAKNYRLRFVSAQSLSLMPGQVISTLAAPLSRSSNPAERILATQLLSKLSDPNEIQLAVSLASDSDSLVASEAWNRLVRSDAARQLDDLIEFGRKNRERKVRQASIQLLNLWKDEKATQLLGELLRDRHPDVRNQARATLLEFAKVESMKPGVIKAAMASLESNWQGIQQSLLILTELDQKPAALQMIGLLDHQRPEVHLTASWALERLSVKETFPPILEWTNRMVNRVKSGSSGEYSDSQYEAVSHLIQLLGKNRIKELEKNVIPKLIPKDMSILRHPVRPAAFWSLGQLYQGNDLPDDYYNQLMERLLDEDPNNPEHRYVKSMCAYVFAVTGCEDAIPSLEKYAESTSPNTRFSFYCSWALNQLDGRPIPKVEPFLRNDTDWFLNPIE